MPAEWEIDLDELLHELQERDDECVLEGGSSLNVARRSRTCWPICRRAIEGHSH